MILKSFKSYLSLLILLIFCSPVVAEDKIDIWKNNSQNSENPESKTQNSLEVKPKQKTIRVETNNDEIKIEDSINDKIDEAKVYGIYDPADYNFNLNMWSSTQADDLKASLNRINKIRLSQTSKEILENVFLSFSYPPQGMSEKEFVKLKVDWLIKNNRSKLIESFLKQNEEFDGKRILVQYLVDENIAKAKINEGCKKIKFIDSTIKDAYLEKFKIYCLVFNKKKPQAQLLLDLLREQKQSDKFFDDKINFLLGISEKTSNKINEKNLLNFYLSSVTIKDFNYTPSDKTKKEIWKYLNAANLIKIDDVNDKERIKQLELAANQERLDKKIIFDIYKQIPFSLNTLINAKNLYQTLDTSDARSLIYQKYLLSEDANSKVEYLFLLEELFKKDDLQKVFLKKMSESFETIGLDNIPEKYLEAVERKIISNDKNDLKKVRYNDKILHQSKIIKFYLENVEEKKIQKDIDKIFRKISKNRKYFYSAKDLALVDALIKDGFKIPDNFNKKELSDKYEVPKNLMQLIEKKQNAFLALKIVEIIGEDEPYQLDPETIYFITNLLNEMDLVVIRNKVLISALPQRP